MNEALQPIFDWLLKYAPIVAPVLGSGVVLAFVQARLGNTERHVAQREVEILSELPKELDAYGNVLTVLNRRTRRWKHQGLGIWEAVRA